MLTTHSPRRGPDRNAVLQSRSAPACQRQRTGDKPWASGVWHALPVCTCVARCTAFPTDGLLSRPRTRARWASTTATPHPDDVTGRLVRSSGSIGCTLCRSSCAIPDLGRAAGWLFGLPPGRIGIFESVLGRPAELSEMRRCQNALYHHTEQEIAPRIDDSRYAPSAAAHAIQAFQTLRDLSLMICTLRVCE